MSAPGSRPVLHQLGGVASGHGHGHGHAEQPYAPVFVGDALAELQALFPKYPTKRACLLPALWIVQERRGWISPDAIDEIGTVLELSPAYIRGVATFYTMYHLHPVGRHFIQVCGTSPCHLCGSDQVLDAIIRETGCGEVGATSADGRFTVVEVECLGACGFATPVLIDDDFHDSVTPEQVPGLLARYS